MGNICCSAQGGGTVESDHKQANGHTAVPGQKDLTFDDSKGKRQALKLLGRGTAADTWLFRDANLKTPVAIKLFPRPINDYPVEAVQREVMTQTDLGPGHINLINVYELFLTDECLGLVMECAQGGSMTSYVGDKWKASAKNDLLLKEDEALYLFKQFISAVCYCHRHNLAHRDLKLDNTLLDGSNPPVLKICDFGFAKHFTSALEKTKSHLGTPEYMSPELLHKTATGENEYYDARSSDIWASGIMLLVSLCGAFPFDNGDQRTKDEENAIWMQEVSQNWQESKFIQGNVAALSEEVKDLLNKILVIEPSERITVDGIMKHPWYQQKLSAKYQHALDDLERQQHELERHVENQKYDSAKIAERSGAVKRMIEEAGTVAGVSAIRNHETAAKALHKFTNMHNLQTIDLTEKVIVSGDTPSRGSYGGPEDPVVKERFNRASVGMAVQGAFGGDSHKNGLHDAVVSRKSRGQH